MPLEPHWAVPQKEVAALKMDLGKIFDLEGESLVVEDVVDLSAVKLSSGVKPFVQPVPVRAVAQNRAGVVTLSLSVSFTLRVPCDRCLEVFEQDYSLNPEHTVVRELNGEDTGEYVVTPDAVVDLDELVLTDVVLELPMVMLCKEDCKGLCSKCGANLNHGTCSCKEETGDPRLAVLKQLIQNDQ